MVNGQNREEKDIFEKVMECAEHIKHYRANRKDKIKANVFRSVAIHTAREIAQEAFCGCGDDRAYSIFYIISAASEMGISHESLKIILKEYGIL